MPAPGEQHRASEATINPFEEVKPHMSEYTAQEIATLQSRLEKQLGPEYISSRVGPSGSKVHYLAAEKCIGLANEVFGFNGWSSSIRDVTVDFIDELPSSPPKINLGLSVIVRVTLRDGSYHEDIGYGHIENCKGKAAAFEKAKKEGTTDALKRALRNFGNTLGNCIYDKDYIAKVTKLKVAPSKWDSENLHRHTDYAPVKKEPIPDTGDSRIACDESPPTLGDAEDEFGDFDEVDFSVAHGEHPDEVALEAPVQAAHFSRKNSPVRNGQPLATRKIDVQQPQHPRAPASRTQSIPSAGAYGPQTPMAAPSNIGPQVYRNAGLGPNNQTNMQRPQAHPQAGNTNRPHGPVTDAGQIAISRAVGPNNPFNPQGQPPSRNSNHPNASPSRPSASTDHDPPIGFVAARAVEVVEGISAIRTRDMLFNPHAESPSIRKTPGIDHTKTKPVGRDIIGAPAQPLPGPPGPRMNFVNPQADQTRRIGMPGGAASPLQNRGAWKQPYMSKRPAEDAGPRPHRPALNDVTSASVNTPLDSADGGDQKRQKLANGQPHSHNANVVAS